MRENFAMLTQRRILRMRKTKNIVYPYMPNSVERIKKEMMDEIGISSIEELLTEIPEDLRYRGNFHMPLPILSEGLLKKHVDGLLNKNVTCGEYISFLGAGCCQHYIPALCDEINGRAEFLTAYTGDTYSDHGKNQAIFEYTSMIGELVDMDVVSFTYYDGGQAVSTALRMAGRVAKKSEVLLPKSISPFYLSQIKDYCKKALSIVMVDYDPKTGQLSIDDLKKKISMKTAAVFIENPSYLGVMEEQAKKIGDIAHENGALFVVCPDMSSLGIMEAPANYGADITCGDIQPLGMHMNYGGGCAGFIATPDEKRFIDEHTTYLYSIIPTPIEGQYGFSRMFSARTSHGSREKAKEYYGTAAGLWSITAAVYMAVMGPSGMEELGENIIFRSNFAKKHISHIKNVVIPFKAPTFKEFVVDFNNTGKTVAEINKALLDRGIFGGKDLKNEFPELGECALYCVTEVLSKDDIIKLADALKAILE